MQQVISHFEVINVLLCYLSTDGQVTGDENLAPDSEALLPQTSSSYLTPDGKVALLSLRACPPHPVQSLQALLKAADGPT